jgi:hypothetical protein
MFFILACVQSSGPPVHRIYTDFSEESISGEKRTAGHLLTSPDRNHKDKILLTGTSAPAPKVVGMATLLSNKPQDVSMSDALHVRVFP